MMNEAATKERFIKIFKMNSGNFKESNKTKNDFLEEFFLKLNSNVLYQHDSSKRMLVNIELIANEEIPFGDLLEADDAETYLNKKIV